MRLLHPLPFARRIVALGAVATLTACSTLPPYSPPAVAVPAHYAGAPAAPAAQAGWHVAMPADAAARGAWWTVFGDADLNTLEARVDVSNQTVKKAVADLQQARAMVDYQHAGFLPTITAGVAQSRSRVSQNRLGSSLAGKTTPDYQAGVAASWEPDVFGRVRDAVTGAQANAAASAADLQAVKLSVTAELATDYFALRSLDTQKQLLDDTVHAYADALTLLKQQLAAGAIDASAVAQADTQLESTRTQDTDIDASRAQLQHAIATLVGESASTFALPPRVQAFHVPAIPAGVPSQLLERRPDIAAAERRVAAANAQIGEARAAFFPDLVLSASAGLEFVLRAVARRAEPVLVARPATRRHAVRRRPPQRVAARRACAIRRRGRRLPANRARRVPAGRGSVVRDRCARIRSRQPATRDRRGRPVAAADDESLQCGRRQLSGRGDRADDRADEPAHGRSDRRAADRGGSRVAEGIGWRVAGECECGLWCGIEHRREGTRRGRATRTCRHAAGGWLNLQGTRAARYARKILSRRTCDAV